MPGSQLSWMERIASVCHQHDTLALSLSLFLSDQSTVLGEPVGQVPQDIGRQIQIPASTIVLHMPT